MKNIILITFFIVTTIFSAAPSFSSDYDSELLFEILTNARLRETPSLSAKTLSTLPGGYVVSVVEGHGDVDEWYRISGALGEYPDGYIHKSLLKPYTFSYELEEFENEYHKIKYFWSGQSGNGYIYSQHHARIYSKSGQFLSHLPRFSDSDLGGVNLIPGGFDDGLPFYELRASSGGGHCCFKYRYLSKSPLFRNVFTIDARYSDIAPEIYDATGNRDYRIKVYDWSYAYWLYSFGQSWATTVIMKIDKGDLSVSQEDMTLPKPTSTQIIDLKNRINIPTAQTYSELSGFFSRLTEILVDLIYSNNAQTAVDLLYLVWPKDLELKHYDLIFDRDTYKTELFKLIKTSQYYQEWMLKGVQ